MRKIRNYLATAVIGAFLLACGGSQDDPSGATRGAANASAQTAAVVSNLAKASPGNTAEASLTATAAAGCTAVTWQGGVNYPMGTVVLYPPNGLYYKLVQVGANGSDGTTPTVSTWYWAQTSAWPHQALPRHAMR